MEIRNKGSITLLGKEMPNLGGLQNIGYMAQSDALYTSLTGEEEFSCFTALFKLDKVERNRRIDYVPDIVNLTKKLHKEVPAYSGEVKCCIFLAIVLTQDLKVLTCSHRFTKK